MQNSIFSFRGGLLQCWMLCIILLGVANVSTSLHGSRGVYLVLVFVSFLYFISPVFTKGNSLQYRFPASPLFRVLLILNIVALARGVIDSGVDYRSFMRLFPSPKAFMPYFLIFISGCSVLSFNYKLFTKLSTISTVVFVLLLAFNLHRMLEVNFAQTYDSGDESSFFLDSIVFFIAPFVLFLQRDILPKKVWNFAFLNILLALFMTLLNARRSSTFGIALVLLVGTYKEKRLRWISIVAVLAVGYLMYRFGMLDFMMERLNEDTRSGVNEGFIAAMDTPSWIYGRGATGTYYDPNAVFLDQNGERTEIETGYLYMVLKGGIIYSITYFLTLSYVAYKGIFQSNNAFARSFGIIIAISLIELVPYGIPTWNLKFFSIWLGVAICLNPKIREMTNQEIKDYYNLY